VTVCGRKIAAMAILSKQIRDQIQPADNCAESPLEAQVDRRGA
jgi:hypothetical protein